MGKKWILIVDDEEPIRNLLVEYLGRNYHCCAASGLSEASEYLASTRFDLVMTDIRMPGGSGYDLCELVREFYPDTRLIVISGLNEVGHVLEATRRGALSYATKPFDLDYVSRLVTVALHHKTGPLPSLSHITSGASVS